MMRRVSPFAAGVALAVACTGSALGMGFVSGVWFARLWGIACVSLILFVVWGWRCGWFE